MPGHRHVDPDRTVVKVRGKTNGLRIERTRMKPRRPDALRKAPGPSYHRGRERPDTSASRQRAKKKEHIPNQETLLESLPPEILQSIFEYSQNLDLPLASPQVAMLLSKSQHLQSKMTDEALVAVTGEMGQNATVAQITRATRLLNSKFMTWDFFTEWLRRNSISVAKSHEAGSEMIGLQEMKARWHSLCPSTLLLPPKKLLHGPFSEPKSKFLNVLAQGVSNLVDSNPLLGEIAREGFAEAVVAGELGIMEAMLGMGLRTDTELLQTAVFEGGCDRDVVRLLISGSSASTDINSEVSVSASDEMDLHNPAVWAWIATNDESGDWLKGLLLDMQRNKEEHQALKARHASEDRQG